MTKKARKELVDWTTTRLWLDYTSLCEPWEGEETHQPQPDFLFTFYGIDAIIRQIKRRCSGFPGCFLKLCYPGLYRLPQPGLT